MIEDHSAKAKADVLDFIIDFLIEHEKNMDRMIARLEKAMETQPKKNIYQDSPQEPKTIRENGQNPFVLTISNPSSFKHVKSIKLDWEDESRSTDISDLGKKLIEKLAHNKETE